MKTLLAEIRERAARIAAGKSRSYVADARWLSEHLPTLMEGYETMFANLTSTQARCSELLEVARAAKALREAMITHGAISLSWDRLEAALRQAHLVEDA